MKVMEQRNKEGYLIAKLSGSSLKKIFNGNIGHWEEMKFKDGSKNAYVIDSASVISKDNFEIFLFEGSYLINC